MNVPLWTWTGQHFGHRDGDDLWTHDGRQVGRFEVTEVFANDGRYLGELMDTNRLVVIKARRGLRRSSFVPQSDRRAGRRPAAIAAYKVPIGLEDFPLPEHLP